MATLIRYLSSEAIENCVLCLKYRFDRVIFYAYKNIKEEEERNTVQFLNKECHIDTITFREIDTYVINDLIIDIEKTTRSDKCFFDLTGCDGICQVAFNDVAFKSNIPIYLFDIRNVELINLNKCDYSIDIVKKQKVQINIEKYIQMVGGVVLSHMHKDNKSNLDKELLQKLESIKKHYDKVWNAFSYCMQQIKTNSNLEARCYSIIELIGVCNYRIDVNDFLNILSDLKKEGLIKKYIRENDQLIFTYANKEVLDTILESGSILEMEVYEHERKTATDCAVGIHLDWDGIIQKSSDGEVINEVDVLRLDNYELTFISCKDTKKIDRIALYELETVARRFGGKYSKMKLVCNGYISKSDKQRAKLIGIELIEAEKLLNQ